MEATQLIKSLQVQYKQRLLLTGLAALQFPVVQTKQLTFYDPCGNGKTYFLGDHHVVIKRTAKKKLNTVAHLLFISKSIELYAQEADQIISILDEINLKDLESHDRAWRLFAHLKKNALHEKIFLKKSIGRRTISLGDFKQPLAIHDTELFVRDGLFVPSLQKKQWVPFVSSLPDKKCVEASLKQSLKYFETKEILPLFHRFQRYANKLESAASAQIEGYDARVETHQLSERLQTRMKHNVALQANLNLDNLHRDLMRLSRQPFSVELLLFVQEALVHKTWKNEEERIDMTPGFLRSFDEVIVKRGRVQTDNVVYIAPKHGDVPLLLQELVNFYHHAKGSWHPLDLAAIVHAQLVIIHPFGDGNGRLARWCFLSLLMQLGFIHSAHQAPVSHILLQEKSDYYLALQRIDRPVMKQATYRVEPVSRRFKADYPDLNIYRQLDYSSWLTFCSDVFLRALNFSIEEHKTFERTQKIYQKFEKEHWQVTASQQHEITRAIDIALKKEWGKKTERRLYNVGLNEVSVSKLKKFCLE